METTTLQTSSKITPRSSVTAAALATFPSGAPSAAQTLGANFGSALGLGRNVRRALVRLTASAPASLTGASLLVYAAGVWTRHSVIADQTFVTGDLSHSVTVDLMYGTAVDVAGTLSAGSLTVEVYPLQTHR